jgi:hypothetical protein
MSKSHKRAKADALDLPHLPLDLRNLLGSPAGSDHRIPLIIELV